MRALDNTEKHEQEDSLPAGWVKTAVADIFTVVGGGTPSTAKTDLWKGSIPWITSADIDDQGKIYPRKSITQVAIVESATNRVPPGSVIVVTRVGLGKVGLAQGELCFSQDCQGLIFHDQYLFPPFVAYQMRVLVSVFKQISRGTTINGVTKKQLLDLNFSLPPYHEQCRIIAEIDKQFTRLDAGVAALERAQANLKRYRASVLKAACEGRLVPTEAELAHKEGRDYEPADRLLARILEEHRARWEVDQLAKMKEQGKVPKDNKWKEKYQEPVGPDTSALPELPEGWIWVKVETLSEFDPNAICAGPFGTIFKAKDFRPEGVPIIFLRHVGIGKYLTHKPGFMDRRKWEELFRLYSVFGGELLVTKLGEPPGVCAIYPHGIGPAMITPDVMKMSVDEKVAAPRFLMHYFNSDTARRFAFGVAFGTTRLRMTLPIFRETPVPLAPLVEQNRIVSEVERRLSVIDELESVIDANLKRAERLRQSILKRAFEGKLVTQDLNDEPASVLLERIRAERQVEQKATAKAIGRPSQKSKRSQVAETQAELFR